MLLRSFMVHQYDSAYGPSVRCTFCNLIVYYYTTTTISFDLSIFHFLSFIVRCSLHSSTITIHNNNIVCNSNVHTAQCTQAWTFFCATLGVMVLAALAHPTRKSSCVPTDRICVVHSSCIVCIYLYIIFFRRLSLSASLCIRFALRSSFLFLYIFVAFLRVHRKIGSVLNICSTVGIVSLISAASTSSSSFFFIISFLLVSPRFLFRS